MHTNQSSKATITLPPLKGSLPQQEDKGEQVVGSTQDPQPLDTLNALIKKGE